METSFFISKWKIVKIILAKDDVGNVLKVDFKTCFNLALEGLYIGLPPAQTPSSSHLLFLLRHCVKISFEIHTCCMLVCSTLELPYLPLGPLSAQRTPPIYDLFP